VRDEMMIAGLGVPDDDLGFGYSISELR